MRLSTKIAFVCLLLCGFVPAFALAAGTATTPLIGAIRWDAWWAPTPNATSTNLYGISSTTFTTYNYRVPFYGWFDTGVANEKAIIDQEINYAADNGLDYWAFDWYPQDGPPSLTHLMTPFNDYMASPYKNRLKFAFMIGGVNGAVGGVGNDYWASSQVPYLVSKFKDPQYLKTADGRPILFWFGAWNLNNIKAGGFSDPVQPHLDYFYAQVEAAGLGKPLIVTTNMEVNSTKLYNFEGMTSYGPSGAHPSGPIAQNCYNAAAAKDVSNWNTTVADGLLSVQGLTPVDDPRPRGYGYWVQTPTYSQWEQHLTDAFSWASTHSANTTNPQLMLAYAWNEIDEGGPGIVPTMQDGTMFLSAIKAVKTGVYPSTYTDTYNGDNCDIVYSASNWVRYAPSTGQYDNDEQISSQNGATATLTTASTTGFEVTGVRGPNRGHMQVFVDGALQGSVTIYQPTWAIKQSLFKIAGLPIGTHTLKIVNVSTTTGQTQVGVDTINVFKSRLVTPPVQKPTLLFSLATTSIVRGMSTTLSWSSTNTTSCTGTGFTASGTSGSLSVTPATTTTYSITCTGAGGSANASATVTVSTPIVNQFAPRGSLDAASCNAIGGWAQDQDVPTQPVKVHIYIDNVLATTTLAQNYRADLCNAIGSCNQSYIFNTPSMYANNLTHTVTAFGLDSVTGVEKQLSSSPKTFQCAPSVIPVSTYKATSTQIWFAPPESAYNVALGRSPNDYMQLFVATSSWQDAVGGVSDFETWPYVINHESDADLKTLFAFLNAHHIALSVAIGINPVGPASCGTGIESYNGTNPVAFKNMSQRIKDLGGTLTNVIFDEPVYFGHQPNIRTNIQPNNPTQILYTGCQYTTAQIAGFAQLAVSNVRSVFPNAVFGDSEPLSASLDTATWIPTLRQWMADYQAAVGTPLAFFHADTAGTIPNWEPQFVTFANYLATTKTALGIFYVGHTNDTALNWTTSAISSFKYIESTLGVIPSVAYIADWSTVPVQMLPDTQPNTLTYVLRQYELWRNPPPPAPTATLSANPASIVAGSSLTLSWSSTNATSCTGTGFTADGTSGSVAVSPTQTATYSIACAGSGGSANATQTVTVTPPADTTPPVLSGAAPTGTLPAGTTSANLQMTTNENALCAYATAAGVAYASMTPFSASTTGTLAHAVTISGLKNSTSYTYYVKCKDSSGNTSGDALVSFTVVAAQGQSPNGYFDGATSLNLSGWAYDPDTVTQPVTVQFYVDGPQGVGVLAGTEVASTSRPDVIRVFPGIGTNHGFVWSLPAQYRTGTHTWYVYAVDTSGNGVTFNLHGSPKSETGSTAQGVSVNDLLAALGDLLISWGF